MDINTVVEKYVKGKRAAFLSLGCKVNAYELSAMRQIMVDAGAIAVSFEEKADFYVVNTCTVTNIADQKSRQMLHKAKRENPDAIVIAAGCYVQAYEEKVKMDDAIDLVIGNRGKGKILEAITEYFNAKEESDEVIKNDMVCNIMKNDTYEELPLAPETEHTRAYLKVQDGCNQFCTYCIIPFARGRICSRKEEDIVAEVKQLAQNGFKEIVITGIHLSSFGMEHYPEKERFDLCPGNLNKEDADSMEEHPLVHLILSVAKIKGIERIRLGSLEPRIITEGFVAAIYKRTDKLCPQFHLSLQSGCDATLKRMARRYTTDDFREGVRILRKYYVNPAITTDIIVGFPGETDDDFNACVEFAKEIGFAKIHVFKYSRRDGTRAALMKDQVANAVKNERSHILIEAEEEMERAYADSFRGESIDVLFEDSVLLTDEELLGLNVGSLEKNVVTENMDDGDEAVRNLDKKLYYRGHTDRNVMIYVRCNSDISGQILPVVLK